MSHSFNEPNLFKSHSNRCLSFNRAQIMSFVVLKLYFCFCNRFLSFNRAQIMSFVVLKLYFFFPNLQVLKNERTVHVLRRYCLTVTRSQRLNCSNKNVLISIDCDCCYQN